MGWGRFPDGWLASVDETSSKVIVFNEYLLLSCSDIMNNKVFYQHPNLMRILGMHETVMEVMVNVLGGDKSQVQELLLLY